MSDDEDKIKRNTKDSLVVKLSEEEAKYRNKYLPDPTVLTDEKFVCTVCSVSLAANVRKGKDLYVHTCLQVLVCEECYNFYGDGLFSSDEDGDDKYCRWCGQGGTLYLCSSCTCGFCLKCVKQNFKASVQAEVEKDDWKCYICSPRALFGNRTICWGAQQINKAAKEKEIEKLKKQRERLEKLEEKKKNGNDRKSRKMSDSEDENPKKRRREGSDSDTSSVEVMPTRKRRDTRSLNGNVKRKKRAKKECSSESSEDEKKTRRRSTSKKSSKYVDSSSEDDVSFTSKSKKKTRSSKKKGSSSDSSEEENKRTTRKSNKKQKDDSEDSFDDKRSKKKTSTNKKHLESEESSSDSEKKKKKNKKKGSSDDLSDGDSKSKTKKGKDSNNKNKETLNEEKTKSKNVDQGNDKQLKQNLKAAVLWLSNKAKDVSDLGSLISLRASKFCTKKVNTENIKTYEDVIATVDKLRKLLTNIHSNFEHIENQLDAHFQSWKSLSGFEETENNISVENSNVKLEDEDASKANPGTVKSKTTKEGLSNPDTVKDEKNVDNQSGNEDDTIVKGSGDEEQDEQNSKKQMPKDSATSHQMDVEEGKNKGKMTEDENDVEKNVSAIQSKKDMSDVDESKSQVKSPHKKAKKPKQTGSEEEGGESADSEDKEEKKTNGAGEESGDESGKNILPKKSKKEDSSKQKSKEGGKNRKETPSRACKTKGGSSEKSLKLKSKKKTEPDEAKEEASSDDSLLANFNQKTQSKSEVKETKNHRLDSSDESDAETKESVKGTPTRRNKKVVQTDLKESKGKSRTSDRKTRSKGENEKSKTGACESEAQSKVEDNIPETENLVRDSDEDIKVDEPVQSDEKEVTKSKKGRKSTKKEEESTSGDSKNKKQKLESEKSKTDGCDSEAQSESEDIVLETTTESQTVMSDDESEDIKVDPVITDVTNNDDEQVQSDEKERTKSKKGRKSSGKEGESTSCDSKNKKPKLESEKSKTDGCNSEAQSESEDIILETTTESQTVMSNDESEDIKVDLPITDVTNNNDEQVQSDEQEERISESGQKDSKNEEKSTSCDNDKKTSFIGLDSSSEESETKESEVKSSKAKVLKKRSARKKKMKNKALLDSSDEEKESEKEDKNSSKALLSSEEETNTKKKDGKDSDGSVVHLSSAESSSDSDMFVEKKTKRKKGKSSDSDGKESADSKAKKKKRKLVRCADSSDESDKSGADEDKKNKKGKQDTPGKESRKNIRKIKKGDDLEEATKEAAEEEKERRKRIEERQKLFNQVFNIQETKVLDKLVLDFDPKNKEELISVDPDLVKKMKPHQAKGVKFMWDSCFESLSQIKKNNGSGCILAHCMGLGKTFQVVSLVHTLLMHEETKVRTVMVVCPLSTVLNWYSEFDKWLEDVEGGNNIDVYHLTKCKQNADRARELRHWQNTGGVLIIGYDMFRNLTSDNKKLKAKMRKDLQETLVDPGADLIVCDEGHMLKNEATALSKAMSRVKTLRRIVLTGTPMQNNLKEYHCMVQFVKPSLLGTRREFLNRFVNPITNGQFVDSTDRDVKIMKRRAHVLHKMLEGLVQRFDYNVLTPFLPPKHEYVISVCLSELQVKLYQHYLDNYSQKSDNHKAGGRLFQDWQALGRIWTHPLVLKMSTDRENIKKMMTEESDEEGSLKDFIDDDESSSSSSGNGSDNASGGSIKSMDGKKLTGGGAPTRRVTRATRSNTNAAHLASSDEEVTVVAEENTGETRGAWWSEIIEPQHMEDMRQSGKLMLLFAILKECETIEDKVLVFSQSLFSLDLIEYFLDKIDSATQEGREDENLMNYQGNWSKGLDYFRLDGSTSSENRSIWCKAFNRDDNPRARLFLISTRAGGLGINLTGANRVIIFDASWNPSHDVQSIFRIYRFGQKKPCYIYRFIAHGTMEEKVYDRQVAKQSMSNRVIDEQQVHRHFSSHDLNELYSFTPPSKVEERPIPSLPKDVLMAEILGQYKQWIEKYHEHDSLLENVEEEELNEEERKLAWEDYENDKKGVVTSTNSGASGYTNMWAAQIEIIKRNLIVRYPAKSEEEIQKLVVSELSEVMRRQQMIRQQQLIQQQQQQMAQMQANPSLYPQFAFPNTNLTQEQLFNLQVMRMKQSQGFANMYQHNANAAKLQMTQTHQKVPQNIILNQKAVQPRQGRLASLLASSSSTSAATNGQPQTTNQNPTVEKIQLERMKQKNLVADQKNLNEKR